LISGYYREIVIKFYILFLLLFVTVKSDNMLALWIMGAGFKSALSELNRWTYIKNKELALLFGVIVGELTIIVLLLDAHSSLVSQVLNKPLLP
jgi:hypothetical protein